MLKNCILHHVKRSNRSVNRTTNSMTQKNNWVINTNASQITAYKNWYSSISWLVGASAGFWNIFTMYVLYKVFIKQGFYSPQFLTVALIFGIVAIALTYYSASHFLNKTIVSVEKDQIVVKDSPLPAFNDKKIDSQNIDQVFITQIEGKQLGTVQDFYELKAKLKDGETQILIPYTYKLPEDKALDLEQKMESFLGISDAYVRGEYIEPVPTNFEKIQQKPKRVSMEDSYIYNSKIEDWIFIKEHHQIIHITQYDWSNGDTDKLYQTMNESEKEQLFYLDRNKGLLNIYSEHAIPLSEVIHLNINSKAPATSFDYQNQLFTLDQVYEGNAFYDGQKGATETKQLVYFSENKNQMIRVVFNGTSPFYFLGSKMKAVDFEELDTDVDQLDLNISVKEKSLDLLDRDFV